MVSIYLYSIWIKLLAKAKGLFRRDKVSGKVVIVKLDEIGDYILFRNFIKEVHHKYSAGEKGIVLIGNGLWKDLALLLDGQYLVEFIGLEMKMKDDPAYLRPLIKQASSLRVELLINASYTRKPLSDIISFTVNAPRKIAFGNFGQGGGFVASVREKVYSEKVILPGSIHHEFGRNLFFYQHILQTKIDIAKPQISESSLLLSYAKFIIPVPYVVVFIGGTDNGRKWPTQKFSALISSLIESATIVLVGGESERTAAGIVMGNCNNSGNLVNLTGETTLVEMLFVIKQAVLVVGNESGIIHMAEAMNIPAVCILGGGHFNRFVPYPEDCHPLMSVVFNHMECFNCDWLCKYAKGPDDPYPCIEGIAVADVLAVSKRSFS